MKTNLIGTAALALALSVVGPNVGQANAGEKPGGIAPKLVITGNATATYHWYKNSGVARTTPIWDEFGYGTLFAIEDSNLYFNATGRMDNGWTDQTFYDWLLNFTGNTAETKNVQENRIRLKGRFGTFMFGNTQGVENIMARGAYSVPGGTGGFDGNFKTTTIRPVGLLLTTDMVGATKYATKATYVTPRFAGFQAGISYTPNSEHKGDGTPGQPHYKTSSKDPQEPFAVGNVALALNYVKDFNQDLSVALALTSQFGRARPPKHVTPSDNTNRRWTMYQTAPRHNVKSYAVGGVLEYKDFEFGVEWINNGKSLQIKNAPQTVQAAGGFNAGQAFSVAGAYTFGFNKVSLGYYHSKRKFNGKNTTGKVYSLDYDRAIAPGFSVFAEGVIYDLKAAQSSATFWNETIADGGNGPSAKLPTGVQKNDGRTLLLGAVTKF